MASTRFKFRASSVSGKQGTLFIQVIHKRVVHQGREVCHGTDTEEDQRRIPTLLHTLIEDVQYRALLVDTQLQTSVFERNITDQDTEADGDQQHRLELIANRQEDEQQADEQHDDVPWRRVRESCVGEEDLNVLHQELRETLSCRL